MIILKINHLTISQFTKDVWRTISRHGQRLIRLVLCGRHRRSAAPRPNEPYRYPVVKTSCKDTCLNDNDYCFTVPKSIFYDIIYIMNYLWGEDEHGFGIPHPHPDLTQISGLLSNVFDWIWGEPDPLCPGCPRMCSKSWRAWERLKNSFTYGTISPNDFEIHRTDPPNPKGNCWAMGKVLGYHFCAKVYSLHALDPSYELGSSRISKLEIRRFEHDGLVVCFERGWDIRPDSEILERAVKILSKRLAKEVFPRWSFRAIHRTIKNIEWFFKRRRFDFERGNLGDFQNGIDRFWKSPHLTY